jgi:hypothetical protein
MDTGRRSDGDDREAADLPPGSGTAVSFDANLWTPLRHPQMYTQRVATDDNL